MNKHIFITAESAVEAIEFANMCLIDKAKQDGRHKGFKDCTDFWTGKVLEIEITVDMSDAEKWAALKKFFKV